MRRALDERRVGRVHLVDISVRMSSLVHDKFSWLSDGFMGGGVVSLIGSHIIDLVGFLTGRRAQRAHALIRTFRRQSREPMRTITSPDFCVFQLELDDGVLVTASLHSDPSNAFEHNVLVCGDTGHLAAIGSDLVLRRADAGEEKLYIDIKQDGAEIKQIPRMYLKGMNNMIRCLASAFTPADSSWNKDSVATSATFDDAFYVFRIIEALKRSSVTRAWEKIE